MRQPGTDKLRLFSHCDVVQHDAAGASGGYFSISAAIGALAFYDDGCFIVTVVLLRRRVAIASRSARYCYRSHLGPFAS